MAMTDLWASGAIRCGILAVVSGNYSAKVLQARSDLVHSTPLHTAEVKFRNWFGSQEPPAGGLPRTRPQIGLAIQGVERPFDTLRAQLAGRELTKATKMV